MPRVAFGTAHLYGAVDPLTSGRLLAASWEVGIRRYDTAPSYGHGRSEPFLGTFLAGREGVRSVSTKVGLEPSAVPGLRRRVLTAGGRTVLPAPVVARLRRHRAAPDDGRFDAAGVRTSVHRSLRHLGRWVDRLLLHEVLPHEVSDELLGVLDELLVRGDVGAVGVATRNHLTPDVVRRCGDLVTVAHLGVGPLHPPVPLPDHVTTRVGHGLLGDGGSHLRALRATLQGTPELDERWQDATATTAFAGPSGLAEALLARATRLDVTDVVVATSRPQQVGRTYACAAGAVPLDGAVADVLDAVVAATAA